MAAHTHTHTHTHIQKDANAQWCTLKYFFSIYPSVWSMELVRRAALKLFDFTIILWKRFVKIFTLHMFYSGSSVPCFEFYFVFVKNMFFNSCCYISYFSYCKMMLWKVQDHVQFSPFFRTRWPSYRLCGILNLQQHWGCLATAGDSGKLLRPMNKSCPPYTTHKTPMHCTCFCKNSIQ